MQFGDKDSNNFSLTRFESMLKTNNVLFFDAEEFAEIVQHYLDNGKMALAKKATKLGLEQHPTSTNLKLYKVEIYIFENKLELADTLLDELYSLEKSNEEILIQKANVLSRRDKHAEAIELLGRALEITNDAADVLSLIGMEHLFLEDFEKAKTNFMRCLEIDNQDYSALYNVIYCFDYLEQHREAIDYLNDFLNANPYSEVGWHQVGKQYYTLKEYKKALAAYDFAIISDDTFIGAYLEKGKVLEKLGRYNEAISSYSITLELDDPTSFALLRIGKCHEKLHNDELALQFYHKCIEEDGLLDKGWIAITDYYNRKKNFQKALYYIDKALNIDSENVLYWKRYAVINKNLSLFEEAEHGFRRTIELGNYEIDSWTSRTDILIQLGEYEAAINNLYQAAEFYPDAVEIEFRLAGLHYLLGEENKGQFHLNNALRIDSEYSIIIEELFPTVFAKANVQKIIRQYENASR